MSLLQDYQAPTATAKLTFETGKPVIFTLLDKPVFLWHDIAFSPKVENQKQTVLYENYIEHQNGMKRPPITYDPSIKGYKGADRKYKHLWLCLVYNHDNSLVQLAEFNHYSLHDGLCQIDRDYELLDTPIKVTKTGEKTETNYISVPLPAKNYQLPENIQDMIKEADINLRECLEKQEQANEEIEEFVTDNEMQTFID